MTNRTAHRSASSTRTTYTARTGFGKGRPRHAQPAPPAPNTLELGNFQLDTANKGNGITLLRTLPDNAVKTAFFDPQYPGGVKNWSRLRKSQSVIHKRRAELHQMSEDTIAGFFRELSRVIAPSGHVFLWVDNFHVRNGIGHWLEGTQFETVDMITWHKNRMGLGYRSRSSAEFVLVLQKKPKRVQGCWSRRDIRSVWEEKVNTQSHTHAKPMALQKALIDATTQPGDLVLDPCAGSFSVMDAALETGRRFIGCDLDGAKRRPQASAAAQCTGKKADVQTPARAVAPKRRVKATPALQKLSKARAAGEVTAQKREAALALPKARKKTVRVPVRSASKVALTSVPKPLIRTARKTEAARKIARKRSSGRGLPRRLMAADGFILVPLPLSALNMLAANEALWTRIVPERGVRSHAPVRTLKGAA